MWAANNATFGLDTSISWNKASEGTVVTISRREARSIKDSLELMTETKVEAVEYQCDLIGIDVETSHFRIETTEGQEISGRLADEFPRGGKWTTRARYVAMLSRAAKITYATGEEAIWWTLQKLIPRA